MTRTRWVRTKRKLRVLEQEKPTSSLHRLRVEPSQKGRNDPGIELPVRHIESPTSHWFVYEMHVVSISNPSIFSDANGRADIQQVANRALSLQYQRDLT